LSIRGCRNFLVMGHVFIPFACGMQASGTDGYVFMDNGPWGDGYYLLQVSEMQWVKDYMATRDARTHGIVMAKPSAVLKEDKYNPRPFSGKSVDVVLLNNFCHMRGETMAQYPTYPVARVGRFTQLVPFVYFTSLDYQKKPFYVANVPHGIEALCKNGCKNVPVMAPFFMPAKFDTFAEEDGVPLGYKFVEGGALGSGRYMDSLAEYFAADPRPNGGVTTHPLRPAAGSDSWGLRPAPSAGGVAAGAVGAGCFVLMFCCLVYPN
jgi:hypothetical protein